MKQDDILLDVSESAIWCGSELEPTDLARMASIAIEKHIPIISVAPVSVSIMWPWLENKNIKIFSRFYLKGHKIEDISNLSEEINQSFKQGADGAQIFVSMTDLNELVSLLYMIRDDLFFNKSLFIGLNINEINFCDWENVVNLVKKIRATGLMLVLPKDSGDKSDFVGRIYSLMESIIDDEYTPQLHFLLGNNFSRIEQVVRLTEAMHQNLLRSLKFFIRV